MGTSGAGSSNLYNSGSVTATTVTVNDLPSNGDTVNARLYTLIDGAWQYNDYTYKTSGTQIAAALTTPTPDTLTPLSGTSVAFAWNPGNVATQFQLRVGTLGVGSSDLYNSGTVTVTTETVSDLPNNDSTVYVRLYSLVNGTWKESDYTYISAGTAIQATLTTPTPNTSTPLTGTSVAFSWTPGNSATHFELYVGTSTGTSNLYNSGNVTATTETVSELPSNGQMLYAGLLAAQWGLEILRLYLCGNGIADTGRTHHTHTQHLHPADGRQRNLLVDPRQHCHAFHTLPGFHSGLEQPVQLRQCDGHVGKRNRAASQRRDDICTPLLAH